MRGWVTLLLYNMVDLLPTIRYSLREEVNGKQQPSLRSLLRTLQRYYSNMYMDAEKHHAINVFLGHFQPQQGKPALWELDSDQHYNGGRLGRAFAGENARSFIIRSQSDGIILCESSSPLSTCSVEQKELLNSALPPKMHKHRNGKHLCDSMPQISTCESDMPYSGQRSADSGHGYFTEHRFDESNFSNFLDLDWFSSSGNLCEETSKRARLGSETEKLSRTQEATGSVTGSHKYNKTGYFTQMVQNNNVIHSYPSIEDWVAPSMWFTATLPCQMQAAILAIRAIKGIVALKE